MEVYKWSLAKSETSNKKSDYGTKEALKSRHWKICELNLAPDTFVTVVFLEIIIPFSINIVNTMTMGPEIHT